MAQTVRRPRLFVEPCAGAAAVTLRLLGGPGLQPPVSWMGGKRRHASHILGAMGLRSGLGADQVLLVDPGPWGWVWPQLLNPESNARVVATVRSWAGEHPVALWDRLAALDPFEDLSERAAQWLWLQARAGGGVPVFWRERRLTQGERETATSEQRKQPGQCGVRGTTLEEVREALCKERGDMPGVLEKPWVSGLRQKTSRGTETSAMQNGPRLMQGSAGRRPPQPAGQRNRALFAFDGRNSLREAGQKASGRGGGPIGGGGKVDIAGFADDLEALGGLGRVQVAHSKAEGLDWPSIIQPGDVVYLDPPYVGCTGYGWDCERQAVLELARELTELGAVVGISEAEGLAAELGDGWEDQDITPLGTSRSKPEFLSLNRPAQARVSVQLGLAL